MKKIVHSFGLAAMSAAAGASGYAFNLLIAKIWGAVFLGESLGVIGTFNSLSIPAMLLVLPISKWSSQNPNWKKRMGLVQGYAIGIGGVLSGVALLLSFPFGWKIPMMVWSAPVYVLFVQAGIFMGRRSYWRMACTISLPQICKPVLLFFAWVVGGASLPPQTVFWVTACTQWGSVAAGMVLIARMRGETSTVEAPKSIMASILVSLVFNVWMIGDAPLAYGVLSRQGLAGYGVISTIGKTTFYLSSHIVNKGIGEKGWGKEKKGETERMVLLLGLGCCIGVALVKSMVFRWFGVSSMLLLLELYLVSNLMLALTYYWIASAAQKGEHLWLLPAGAMVCWVIWCVAEKPPIDGFVWSMFLLLVVTLFGTRIKYRRLS